MANFVDFRYSTEMKEKSIIIGLPVVPFNQSKHSDVCSYLQYVRVQKMSHNEHVYFNPGFTVKLL